ncbi:MAG: ABC transporter ATP-binding protein [Desulfobacteraceae bacterium]|jgi:branched-chain amino acid transport system ATP-binding protein|nr:ABC transporter ATP-binding protein [Desulfobacteraceae bacterium]MBC2750674.1 ABC transporter ATP-binding protein [Desulfobacteraceae bacterium]
MLTVENLKVSYGNIKALHGIDFTIDAGEIICIIGANGAGKSTTLWAISRLVKVEDGTRMTYDGKNLLEYPADKVVSELGITHVPEGRRLFGNLTVMENLRLATFARRDAEQIEKDLDRMFGIFPRLKERESQKSGTLSGGEQQMLAIARAFMSGRKIMLLDEPSMGLAPLLMMDVFDALKEINQQEGTAIMLVEQNARLALQFSTRGYVLENGNLVLEGKSSELLNDPEVQKAYLGG